MKTIIIIMLMLLVTVGRGVETEAIAGEGIFGATTLEKFQELDGYLNDEDRAAFESTLTEALLTGECTMFYDGEEVYVQDYSAWSGWKEVRRVGDTVSYWTYYKAT